VAGFLERHISILGSKKFLYLVVSSIHHPLEIPLPKTKPPTTNKPNLRPLRVILENSIEDVFKKYNALIIPCFNINQIRLS